ncbi:DUF1090 domain-containing protein [Entomomonas asaccharolytica]|uniref:DUF1090 domain-containing protein n=1 Tax=Entomomonas asaccharolytica TaxID=2785331 RepID=A0A974RVX2_9GAMM|nr:DUF1090 domain-containing protein [Entomomonas asaccharolytica]QQP84560.1 DUF1090 domain-containing protein [Entomomonas asaccharolytica]
MRKLTVGAALLSVCLANTVVADYYHKQQGCKIKIQKLQQQLEYAKTYGNTNRVQGLERAIANVKTYCLGDYDENYSYNDQTKDISKLKSKVADKQEKVDERNEELLEAIAKGDPEKIVKKTRKLKEAMAELEEAKSNLALSTQE